MPDRVSRVHIPRYLQDISLGFSVPDLYADRFSPRIPVANQSDLYRVFGKNNLIVRESRWAPGAIPNEIEIRWSSDSYFAELRKLRILLLDTELRNSDNIFDLRGDSTEAVTEAMAIQREKRVADLFTTAGNYSAYSSHVITKAGGSEWDTLPGATGMNPLLDMQSLIALISQDAMVAPSQLSVAIPQPVYTVALQNNAGILGRVQYSERGIVTTDIIQALLGVKEVFLVNAMTAGSGPEVAGSDVITGYPTTYLWGDNVWIGLINPGTNQRAPTFSRSFVWRAETGGQDRQIRQYRAEDEGREADWIECKEAIGEKIVFQGAGGVIKNTLSTI